MHTSTGHRLVFLLCFLLTLPVSVGASLGLWPVVIAARQPQQDDQIINIPYFSESADGHSILTVQNNLPDAVAAKITVFNSKGRPHTVPPVILAPMLPARFSLKQLTGGVKGDFSSGNIQIFFQGPPLGVTCQVSVVSERDRFSFESFAAMESSSTKLRGIAWIPNSGARVAAALTNTSGSGILVAIGGSTGGHRQTKNIALGSRETEVVDLKYLIGVRPESPEAALFDLEHSGKPGDLISTGFVLDAKTGFSSNLNFVDSQTFYSTKLAGARFRFGVPDPQEGFPDNTRFTALLAVANVATSAIDARIVVDLTSDDETQNLELEQIHLEPGGLQQIDLWRELRRLGVAGPVSNAGIEITYDATPGSLIASLVSVDQSGDFSFDTPVKDPALNSVSGTYPFRLDNGHSAVLHLKNTTGQTTHAIMQVRFEGGTYNPERIKLRPHQTVGFDLREMRDAQKPDIRGGIMPRDVMSGQIIWYAEEVGILVGRAEVFSVAIGVASTFSCPGSCNQSCPPRHLDSYMDPASGAIEVGTQAKVLTPLERTVDCMDTIFGPFDMSDSSEWTSSDTSVATVAPGGQITALTGGTTGITARHTVYTYGQVCNAIQFQVTAGGAVAVVQVSVFTGQSTVPLDSSGHPSVTNSIPITASGSPSGGTYSWSTTSSRVSLSNTTSATVTATSVSASSLQNDVTVTVTYTYNGQTATATKLLTVVKPSSLVRLFPDEFYPPGHPNSHDCAPLSCSSYLRRIRYNFKDQFGNSFNSDGAWTVIVTESYSNFTSSCQAQPLTGNVTGQISQITDDFWICSTACSQCNPQGQGCTSTGTQLIAVNGFAVRTNSVSWTCTDATIF